MHRDKDYEGRVMQWLIKLPTLQVPLSSGYSVLLWPAFPLGAVNEPVATQTQWLGNILHGTGVEVVRSMFLFA
jgi:hypothetical protein